MIRQQGGSITRTATADPARGPIVSPTWRFSNSANASSALTVVSKGEPMKQLSTLLILFGAFFRTIATEAAEPPTEWIDPDTGHRVVRLSKEPGSASLYFHQNAYSADGQKLIITTPSGVSAIDLKTRAIEQIVETRSVL